MEQNWLEWGRKIHALAQNGLTFTKDPFDRERYESLIGIAAEILASHSVHPPQELAKIFSAEQGYSTPKLDVRAAAFRDGKLLLVKENDSGGWTLPGGYVDVNESLGEATAREVLEESGIVVHPKKVAAIFDHRLHGYRAHLYHFYKVYMLCEYRSGEPRTQASETSGADFFDKRSIESLPLDPARATKAHVLRMFDHFENPGMPTDFD